MTTTVTNRRLSDFLGEYVKMEGSVSQKTEIKGKAITKTSKATIEHQSMSKTDLLGHFIDRNKVLKMFCYISKSKKVIERY